MRSTGTNRSGTDAKTQQPRAAVAVARPSMPMWEGDIGATPREWLEWALRFAQNPPGDGLATRTGRELATFALRFLGIGPRRVESESGRRLRGARAWQEARRPANAEPGEVLAQMLAVQSETVRILRRGLRADAQQPSAEQVRSTARTLHGVVKRLMAHQPVKYHVPPRTVRWDSRRGEYLRYRAADPTHGRAATKDLIRGGRFVIHHAAMWADLAVAHLCELVARFGHEVQACPGRGTDHVRWFLPSRTDQRFCLPRCRDLDRVTRFRRRRPTPTRGR